MHYCEYDRNRPEPCGKPAGQRFGRLWLCAKHLEMTERFLYLFDPSVSDEERKRRQRE